MKVVGSKINSITVSDFQSTLIDVALDMRRRKKNLDFACSGLINNSRSH